MVIQFNKLYQFPLLVSFEDQLIFDSDFILFFMTILIGQLILILVNPAFPVKIRSFIYTSDFHPLILDFSINIFQFYYSKNNLFSIYLFPEFIILSTFNLV